MPPTARSQRPPEENDQGAHLVVRTMATHGSELVRLPNSRVGIECPSVLEVAGPVHLAGREVQFAARLQLDSSVPRYIATYIGVGGMNGPPVDPDLLRQLRWAELLAVAVGSLRTIVLVDDEAGVQEIHRSSLGLTPEEQIGGLWLQAQLAGQDPNRHISEELRISRSAAAARVKRARDNKTIPPATQGQRH